MNKKHLRMILDRIGRNNGWPGWVDDLNDAYAACGQPRIEGFFEEQGE